MNTRILSVASAAAVVTIFAAAMQLSARDSEYKAPIIANSAVPSPHGAAAAYTLVVAPDSNTARYRVREQLAGFDLPNDAVGETSDVTGSIALDKAGKVIPEASKIVVGVANLKSDKQRRDGYIRGRVLEAERFPSVEFAVTNVRGPKLPFPTSGSQPITLEGNLTVHGVTRPVTWTGNAVFARTSVSGKAITKFTFSDFQLTQPRVPVVLSVADTIGLEYDFKFQRAVTGK